MKLKTKKTVEFDFEDSGESYNILFTQGNSPEEDCLQIKKTLNGQGSLFEIKVNLLVELINALNDENLLRKPVAIQTKEKESTLPSTKIINLDSLFNSSQNSNSFSAPPTEKPNYYEVPSSESFASFDTNVEASDEKNALETLQKQAEEKIKNESLKEEDVSAEEDTKEVSDITDINPEAESIMGELDRYKVEKPKAPSQEEINEMLVARARATNKENKKKSIKRV
jgi:hypothetical protein